KRSRDHLKVRAGATRHNAALECANAVTCDDQGIFDAAHPVRGGRMSEVMVHLHERHLAQAGDHKKLAPVVHLWTTVLRAHRRRSAFKFLEVSVRTESGHPSLKPVLSA